MRAVKSIIRAAGNLKAADMVAGASDDAAREAQLLLKSLIDVNEPKFVAADLPLFRGILSDLFPAPAKGAEPEGAERAGVPDAGTAPAAPSTPTAAAAAAPAPAPTRRVDTAAALQSALATSASAAGLQPVAPFLNKCTQLYETLVVRHGVMVVGAAAAGKTAALRTTRDALGALSAAGITGAKIAPVAMRTLNPKSITLDQLYGGFDPNTREWSDGIASTLVREAVDASNGATGVVPLQWIVFDGPVDAIWIESMNTVLGA